MKILLLFILPFALYASKILSYNIYDRTDRVDIMITFDTPYDGAIRQSTSDSAITIKLEGASIESSKVKQLNSKYIKSITITPMQEQTQIVALVPSSVKLQASKTGDAYGLRLRFAAAQEPKESQAQANQEGSLLDNLPTKQDNELEESYYLVITILIIGIIILIFLKKRVSNAQAPQKGASWLFKESQEDKEVLSTPTQNISSFTASDTDSGVAIRFQKSIGEGNSVVMLDFMEQSYLVLMGKNNILLDKFTDNKPVDQSEFETILQNRHKQLEEFLNSDGDTKDALRSYKERAASISYEV
ncbi:MAG: hypothetical protein QG559_772 [Campylobacterota bacterium]|nr:hypothetical protein [Campylobacterota bacterium]